MKAKNIERLEKLVSQLKKIIADEKAGAPIRKRKRNASYPVPREIVENKKKLLEDDPETEPS